MKLGHATLDWAVYYVSYGIPVIPVYKPVLTPGGVSCSCGNQDCRDIGKHPVYIPGLVEHGSRTPLCDISAVQQAWDFHPQANIGICVGASSGWMTIDIDPRNGGLESYLGLCTRLGCPLPDAYRVQTGCYRYERGLHFHMCYPGGLLCTCKLDDYPGVDILGSTGYAIAPPSLHKSGVRYELSNTGFGDPPELPPCPQPWLDFFCEQGKWQPNADPPEPNPPDINKTSTNNTSLFPCCCSISRGSSKQLLDLPWVRELLWERKAPRGEPWAEAVFPAKGDGEQGMSYLLAKRLTGHLVRYAATDAEARELTRFIVYNAKSNGRFLCNGKPSGRTPEGFTKLVLSLLPNARLASNGSGPAEDLGWWRYGKTVWFSEEHVQQLQRMTPHHAAIMYAIEVYASLHPDRQPDLPYSELRNWASLASGKQVINRDVTYVIDKYSSATRKRPVMLTLVTRGNYPQSPNGYRVGSWLGDQYHVASLWGDANDLTHRAVEEQMGWPSFYAYNKRWVN